MQLIRGLADRGRAPPGCAITVGAYDGIHLGHQGLLQRLRVHARRLQVPTLMVTFEPLPREYLCPADPPPRLTSLRERWQCLAGLEELDYLCVLRFGEPLRSLSGLEFVTLLAQRLRPPVVLVGHDFRFGRNGEGTGAQLQQAGAALGFEVDVADPVKVDQTRVSSSAVREALAAGNLRQAERWLGRPFSLMGRVVRGEQLGRKLGFPTANVRFPHRRVPLAGIFAVRLRVCGPDGLQAPGIVTQPGVALPGAWLPGVASIGTRPTVGGVEPLLEVHVFDFDADLYGRHVEVQCAQYLRPERRFDTLPAMVAQMQADAAAARRILKV